MCDIATQVGMKNKETIHDFGNDKSLEGFERLMDQDWVEEVYVNTKVIEDDNP